MAAKIIAFGQITEITGKEFEQLATDTDSLRLLLNERYPALCEKKYVIAVNKKIVTQNTTLNTSDMVALLPPYSGG